MNYQKAMQALEAGKKLSRKAWGSEVICKKLTGIDMIPWKKVSSIMAVLVEKAGLHPVVLDSIWLFDIKGRQIKPRWNPTAEDLEAEDWRVVFVKPRQCRVCGKKFDLGDEQSPIFQDDIWNQVLVANGFKKKNKVSWIDPLDDSGYICYECVEKALGRKITKDDLANVSFNEPFNEFYFKE